MATIEFELKIAAEDRVRIDRLIDVLEGTTTTVNTTINTVGEVSETTTKAKTETKKPAAKKAAAKKPAAKKEPVKEPEVDPLDASEEHDKESVRAALMEYREIEGTEALMSVLGEFGAKTLDAVKEDDYAAIVARVQ